MSKEKRFVGCKMEVNAFARVENEKRRMDVMRFGKRK